jgi:predicted DNA-binding transcriptional regulator AlpA
MTKIESQTIEPLLLNAEQAARLLGIGRSKFYSLHNAGLLPLPVSLGGCVRWDLRELKAWLSARNPQTGTLPNRQQWAEIQGQEKREKKLVGPARRAWNGSMKSVQSNLLSNPNYTVGVCLSVRTTALVQSVMSPGHLILRQVHHASFQNFIQDTGR